MNRDFVFVDESVPGIRWDAKYATWDNFTGKPVDGYLANRIVGTMALCAALQSAQVAAASLGFGLASLGWLSPSSAPWSVFCAGQSGRKMVGRNRATIRILRGLSCSKRDM